MGFTAVRGEVVIGEHRFIVRREKKIAVSNGQRDEAELKKISEEYQGFKQERWPWVEMRGQWRWCKNHRCPKAFYVSLYRSRKDEGFYCSHHCAQQDIWQEKQEFCQWFGQLPIERRAGWLVDTVHSLDSLALCQLGQLTRFQPEKLRETLKEIYRSQIGAARRIVEQFIQTPEGKTLKEFVEKENRR